MSPTQPQTTKTKRADRSEEMRRLLTDFSGSKESVQSFCSRNGFSKWNYHYWRRKLGMNMRRRKGSRADNRSIPFVKLSIPGNSPQVVTDHYEIVFPNGFLLRIPLTGEHTLLEPLLKMLRG